MGLQNLQYKYLFFRLASVKISPQICMGLLIFVLKNDFDIDLEEQICPTYSGESTIFKIESVCKKIFILQ